MGACDTHTSCYKLSSSVWEKKSHQFYQIKIRVKEEMNVSHACYGYFNQSIHQSRIIIFPFLSQKCQRMIKQ